MAKSEKPILNKVGKLNNKIMKDNLNLDDVSSVRSSASYQYNLTLKEFNGQCQILYSTSSPLLCSRTMNLVTTDGSKIVAFTSANTFGGNFDTGEPWGSEW